MEGYIWFVDCEVGFFFFERWRYYRALFGFFGLFNLFIIFFDFLKLNEFLFFVNQY